MTMDGSSVVPPRVYGAVEPPARSRGVNLVLLAIFVVAMGFVLAGFTAVLVAEVFARFVAGH
ncbi:MAG: hypothetical protein QOI44_994 [Actinomycetota bacterium]|nr:hypothetical protein [Actinomycetota bacterium]